MAMSLYRSIRPVLFQFEAERIHHATLRGCQILGTAGPILRAVQSALQFSDPGLTTRVAGIEFANPVGLGAGFDKNGVAWPLLAALGFGFIEVGSVSARPSAGNRGPRRRLWRLPADEALMVNYGVPNDGAAAIRERVGTAPHRVPLGINVVETNTGRPSEIDAVISELTEAARCFVGHVDYLVVNLSCPNTSDGVGHFDAPDQLKLLLQSYGHIDRLPPVFLKVRHPEDGARIDATIRAVEPFRFVHGFILNALASKPYVGLRTAPAQIDAMRGTLTGRPLRNLANAAVRTWYRRIDRRRHRIIGVGGIASGRDAYETLRLGASLVQVATGLIFHGPGLVGRINRELAELLRADGIGSVSEIVGADNG